MRPRRSARPSRSCITDSADASWVESNLLSLIGLGAESQLGGDRRGEAFSAWRLFFEAMAERRPLVLVFEDLHWADESLLDFVDELVEWVTDVPLLVVATARPELLERRAAWGGGKLNATTLAVSPLSDEQTAQLIGRLLDRPLLAADAQQALLERAGGNPLYAEQFSELYLERGSTEELPLPETLQGIIAARLDGLVPEEKEILRDAAVIGKVFWVGALGRHGDAAAALHSLERKGFVRRQRRTSVEGESRACLLTRARARCGVRPDRPSGPRRETPPDRGVDRGPRTTGGSRRDAGASLAFGSRARPRSRPRRRRPGRPRSLRAPRGRRSRLRPERVRIRRALLRGSARAVAGLRPGATGSSVPARAITPRRGGRAPPRSARGSP